MKKFFHSNNNKFLIVYEEDFKVDKILGNFVNIIDGTVVVNKIEGGFVFFDLFNIDGSRAEVSGNGLACLSLFLYKLKKIKNFKFINSFYKNKIFYSKVVDLNYVMVGFDLSEINLMKNKYINWEIYELIIPNPHLVLPLSGISNEDGKKIANKIFEDFQKKYNVHVFDIKKMFMYSFERGVGFTTSCGSGTIACSYVYVNFFNNKNKELVISSEGGSMKVFIENTIYWIFTKPTEFLLEQ